MAHSRATFFLFMEFGGPPKGQRGYRILETGEGRGGGGGLDSYYILKRGALARTRMTPPLYIQFGVPQTQ